MIPKGLLPEPYAANAFIAGGYAACPALAQDMDVWVLSPNPEQTRLEILGYLKGSPYHRGVVEQSDVESAQSDLYEHECTILKVAEVHVRGFEPPIHIVVADAKNVLEILDGFDVSTHQVAITPAEGIVRGPHWTPVNEPPVAFKANINTPKRMERITARFAPHTPEAF